VIQPIPALDQVGDSAQQIIIDIPAAIPHNNDIEELQNSLRTFRLSNDGLALLLERSQAELDAANARVTHLEQKCELIEQEKQQLINQHTAEYQAVVGKLDCAEKNLIEARKVNVNSMGEVSKLESSIELLEIENFGYLMTVEENNEVIDSRNNRIEELLYFIEKKDGEILEFKKQSHIDLNKLNEVQEKLKQFENQNSLLSEKLNHITIEKESLCSQLAESNVQKQSISNVLCESNAYNSKIKEELLQYQSDCKKYCDNVQKLKEKNITLENDSTTINAQNSKLKDQLSTVTKENEILLNDIMKLKDNIGKREIELKGVLIDTSCKEMVVEKERLPPDETTPIESPVLDFRVCR
jgi:chromosome segregation ATPase